ncbi:MAG TPA: RidA family protein [Gemmatimonadota bacterium]|jgi:enamine deaminase RidA (YjgF/YER057c/UK114 family)
MTRFEYVNPEEIGRHTGFSHGIVTPAGGRVLFVAGQTAPGAGGFVSQFAAALARALAVVRDAGGRPEHVARMTVYVTDMAIYRAERSQLGEAWRAAMGRHYPAMALVEVRALFDPGAVVEIEATAVLPPTEPS